jgi:hypothetical protein
MAGSAVARCLGTLTAASAGAIDPALLSLDPSLPASADVAAALRRCAQSEIARHREASRFGELAVDALGASALEIGEQVPGSAEVVRATLARYSQERRLADLATTFVSHDLAHAFRHFVERDTPAHVGGPRLRVVSDAERLAAEVAGLCRATTRTVPFGGFEESLRAAVESAPAVGHARYQEALRAAVTDSLRVLGVNP